MRLPDAESPGSFLSRYWQKMPLFMPGALGDGLPSLDPGGLAWLATQEDVESRLIHTEHAAGNAGYTVSHGPFDAHSLSSLPERDWTLLVHDVEKHLPDFRAWFEAIDFIPDWRIDDLMVSYAAPGGSAGPHRDNYDVFLCQGQGRREWRLGSREDSIAVNESAELSLLEPFDDDTPRIAGNGDVLYLPPGIPHWGIARDECLTYSIGMRAPRLAELATAARCLPGSATGPGKQRATSAAEVFYEDPDLSIDEAAPGLISDAAIQRAKQMLFDVRIRHEREVAFALGSVATELKSWLEPERLSADEVDAFVDTIGADAQLSVHGMARIAWARAGEMAMIFANGRGSEVPVAYLECFRDLCRERRLSVRRIRGDGDDDLLRLLLTGGVIDLTEWSR